SNGVQSAMVVIDPKTGGIKGIVGGIGTKTESRGLNRATQSKRQPGSSVKPIAVYAPSLENGKITAATIITDEALTVGTWSPQNSYKGFKGDMSVRKAIEISANIPAVKTLQTLGTSKSYEFMTKKLGFTSLTSEDNNLSALGLGGMSKGVSPKEMAAAYAMFANKGVYITPHTYTKVLDNSGKVLLETKPEKIRALSEANAYIMTSFLKDVVNGSAGTGRNARLSKVTAYGKTGTSNDNKDKWFCGFTTEYAGAVWYGYDAKKSVGSTNISTQVWKKVMEKVHEGMSASSFEKPDSVTAVSVCQLTGKLSSSGCGYGKTEYFARGTLPTKYCDNNHSGVIGASGVESPSPSPEVSGSPEPTASGEPQGTSEPTVAPTVAPTKAPDTRPTKNPEPEDDGVITLD
ncbi:MAG: glycosyl transferase, partial [Clostridia bacterium]|nr:glycosyl transferase [Clostridia bacterium]